MGTTEAGVGVAVGGSGVGVTVGETDAGVAVGGSGVGVTVGETDVGLTAGVPHPTNSSVINIAPINW
ncbi:MAG: hypothetical protein WHX52_05245 [Anaerolineae bacterium]